MTRMACDIAPTPLPLMAETMIAVIPVLETDRVILRAPRLEDFATYAEITASPRGVFLDVPAREDAWYDFCAMVANWTLRGHGVWTITTRDGGTVQGFVLIGFEPGDEAPELDFMLTDGAEGSGIAFEAAQAARAHALGTSGLRDLVSYVDAGNARSIALAKRLGAPRDGDLRDGKAITIRLRHAGKAGI
ncbi:MAG: GNAT family N-acetyltransferase [Rhodobacteraceae bacterium]|nr:GNAT family N-acetyltransferase [Paracoccaceae bacterium]